MSLQVQCKSFGYKNPPCSLLRYTGDCNFIRSNCQTPSYISRFQHLPAFLFPEQPEKVHLFHSLHRAAFLRIPVRGFFSAADLQEPSLSCQPFLPGYIRCGYRIQSGVPDCRSLPGSRAVCLPSEQLHRKESHLPGTAVWQSHHKTRSLSAQCR